MTETTRLTEKGQATVPKEFRERYGLAPGDELVWQEGDDGILVRKKQASARGALLPDESSDETREAVAQALEQRIQDIRDQNQPTITEQSSVSSEERSSSDSRAERDDDNRPQAGDSTDEQ